MLETIKAWLLSTLEWLKELFLWIPRKIWQEVLDGFASFLESIPVPSFISDASSAFSGISGNILFFAQKFAVGEGIAMVLAAYLLRFLLRRIPLIG